MDNIFVTTEHFDMKQKLAKLNVCSVIVCKLKHNFLKGVEKMITIIQNMCDFDLHCTSNDPDPIDHEIQYRERSLFQMKAQYRSYDDLLTLRPALL